MKLVNWPVMLTGTDAPCVPELGDKLVIVAGGFSVKGSELELENPSVESESETNHCVGLDTEFDNWNITRSMVPDTGVTVTAVVVTGVPPPTGVSVIVMLPGVMGPLGNPLPVR